MMRFGKGGGGKLRLTKSLGRTGNRSDKGSHRKLGGKGVFKGFGFGVK